MNEWAQLTEYNWVLWLAGTFALAELAKWIFSFKEFVFSKIGIKTKKMLKQENFENRLVNVEKAIEEIRNTSRDNVNMFLEHEEKVVKEFNKSTETILGKLTEMHTKMDEQNEASNKTDLAILRDRIVGGMRYFSQNKDEREKVHISFSDHENMEALFQEYFKKGGNGTIKNMYNNEFKRFNIDR